MRPRNPQLLPSSLLALAAGALLSAACGSNTPPASVSNQPPTTILTATPYPRPPTPTIVDPSGAVAGTGAEPNFREVPYRVEAGDTLIGIAVRFDTTVEAIVTKNKLANASDLKIGQDLIIPTNSTVVATAVATSAPTPAGTAAARTPTPAAASTASATSTPPGASSTATPTGTGTPAPGSTVVINGVRTYIVERGDTASGIAAQFDTSTEELAKANNRTVASLANIQPGDRLTLPPAR